MKYHPAIAQKQRERTLRTDSAASDGAVALAPPAYGIDAVDKGFVAVAAASSAAPVQRTLEEEDDKRVAQGKFDCMPRRSLLGNADAVQRMHDAAAPAQASNQTGLPDSLRGGIEALSGMDVSDVRVHRNSAEPARLGALAYAQGSDIHLAPGQDEHLPHEAWHVVQQRQGRVQPTLHAGGVQINDDAALEREADRMGEQATRPDYAGTIAAAIPRSAGEGGRVAVVAQRRLPPGEAIETEIELGGGQLSAQTYLYQLLHMEFSQGRLLRPMGGAYNDAFQALADVFPDGRFSALAYAALYAANQKYSQVLPSEQRVSDTDWRKIEPLLERAVYLARKCATLTLSIKNVFGPDADVEAIQATYLQVARRLAGFGQDNFTIDYHGDDAEMGVAGATSPGSGRILVSETMLGKGESTVAVLLLHEGCHEVDANIVDCGYYGTARFDKMSQRQKKRNAAHYEEVARRYVGISRYRDQVFQPEAEQQVEQGPRREQIRKTRIANEGLRNLWNAGVGLHTSLRDIAAGVSALPAQQQVEVVNVIKDAFQLPKASVGDAPVVTQLDLALLEATIKVLKRAMSALDHFKNEQDPEQRRLLVAMSPKQLLLSAVKDTGGIQGFSTIDRRHELQLLQKIRAAIILSGIDDPFPHMDVT